MKHADDPLEKPAPVAEPDALRAAIANYDFGDDARLSATALPGEFDANFVLSADDGRRWVLKVMHPARQPRFIEMQCAALRHLERTQPGLNVSRVIRTRGGADSVEVAIDGVSRIVWLLTYLDGRPLGVVRPRTGPMFA